MIFPTLPLVNLSFSHLHSVHIPPVPLHTHPTRPCCRLAGWGARIAQQKEYNGKTLETWQLVVRILAVPFTHSDVVGQSGFHSVTHHRSLQIVGLQA
ncbi:hypothetical protein P7K49_024258 [Saguinus oedipus]|uniref:Uncharacterized protein n=1 Tax=Saguinus oedipus TaxID=9490 RepID=A0ABQ9UNZ7_SAGOE|nr:hypothetical protein P7K49_024258 [Saguinus oedipus]